MFHCFYKFLFLFLLSLVDSLEGLYICFHNILLRKVNSEKFRIMEPNEEQELKILEKRTQFLREK